MRKLSDRALTRDAERLKALGHPTRLCFYKRLIQRELCVCEIECPQKLDLSTVSRHLAVMRNAGLIASRREGQKVFYRVVPEALQSCRALFEAFVSLEQKGA